VPSMAHAQLPRERRPSTAPEPEPLDIMELPPSLHLDVWLCYAMWLGGVFGSLYCMQQQIASWAMAETLSDSDSDDESDSSQNEVEEDEAPTAPTAPEPAEDEWTHVTGAVNVELGTEDDAWDMVEIS